MPRLYLLTTDLRRCVGCGSCQVSCKMQNKVPMFHFRSKLNSFDEGAFPDFKRHFLQTACNQCASPSCIDVCPTDATYMTGDGIIAIDKDKCIGCESCIGACPYGARYMYESSGGLLADKCDYCKDVVDAGGEPACVRNCMGKARVFGDINDKNSAVYKLLAGNKHAIWREELGTEPRTAYILKHPNTLKDHKEMINEVK